MCEFLLYLEMLCVGDFAVYAFDAFLNAVESFIRKSWLFYKVKWWNYTLLKKLYPFDNRATWHSYSV